MGFHSLIFGASTLLDFPWKSHPGDVLREEELKKKAVVEAALDKLLWHWKLFLPPLKQTAIVRQL